DMLAPACIVEEERQDSVPRGRVQLDVDEAAFVTGHFPLAQAAHRGDAADAELLSGDQRLARFLAAQTADEIPAAAERIVRVETEAEGIPVAGRARARVVV